MSKINDYSENTTANESDVYIQETTSGPRKITFSTILSGIISKFLKSTQKSSLTATNKGTTSSREYAVGLDANGQMSVNVPWVDTNTVTSVVNDLTSSSTTSALSAAQGKYLQSEITDLNSALSNKLNKSWKQGWDTTATEHFILVGVANAGYLICYLPRMILSSTAKTIQLGSGSVTAGIAVTISISTISCSVVSCYVNGSVGTATLTIYSR